MTAAGQYQVATVSTGNIYISANYGSTWTSTSSSLQWKGVAISSSGQYITAVAGNNNYIYASYNSINNIGILYGVTGIFSNTLTAAAFVTTSDYRVKENVQDLNLAQYTVNDLRPVNYHNKLLGKQDIGFIAHEVQEHYPFLVSGEKDGAEYQSLNYTGLIGIAVKEIKEIKEQTIKMNQYLELNEKLTTLGDIDLCGNYLTNIEGFHFMDGSIQKTGYNTLTKITFETTSFDIYEIKRNNYYINKSPSGLITWNIYVDNFTQVNNGSMFYFINNTGHSQHFHFMGDASKINIYNSENDKLDINREITIESSRIRILYINNGSESESAEMYVYILNK
jgi:hypothetical protein